MVHLEQQRHDADEPAGNIAEPILSPVPAAWDLKDIVDELRLSRDVTHNVRHLGRLRPPPLRRAIDEALTDFSAALFPAHYGPPGLTPASIDAYVGETLDRGLTTLREQVRRTLPFSSAEDIEDDDLLRQSGEITRLFAAQLPDIRGLLVSDLRAAYAGDPAGTGYSEILLVYPGITAIIHHRLAHALLRLGATFLARMISDIARSKTGIDIHPGAEIGPSFFIDHGTGVVIGETAIVGARVRLYQAVTLGARSFPADETGVLVKGHPRHPIIEDDVVIYAGATVLGRITVGKGSSIGGSVWLTRSVPPGSQISQAQTRSGAPDG
ncbi:MULTISPECIES: serine O-acetyltransferase EpsC [unclassified Aureimonas]|uniref:serine O-acetyltransferase EpsC n=1 Tax=unclassified Aureimonas TaxID=2615206 RepID=UPI0009E6938B|nr:MULTISPECIES: serine O-acetyltransferase EpsC [unclassified Aureimonas]